MVKAKHRAPAQKPVCPALRQMRDLVVPTWKQSDIAKKLGVSQQAVSHWIQNKAKPGREHMAEIERLLGIPMRDWVDDEAEESTKRKTRRKAA